MQNTTIATQTTNTAAEFATAMPSIKVDSVKAKVSVTTGTKSGKKAEPAIAVINTNPKLSVERAIEDDESLVKHERSHYVAEFKRGVEKTARATLETCRVVYEANRVLDNYQFQNFCTEVGYRDGSSSIRKFIAIGKVYPRFIQYADQLRSIKSRRSLPMTLMPTSSTASDWTSSRASACQSSHEKPWKLRTSPSLCPMTTRLAVMCLPR